MKITEHNITDNKIVVRDANEYELSKFDKWQKYEEEIALAEAEAATKKAEAEAKLASLGLTSDDLKALGL